jgi:HD superfamily phosphohydrolase
MPAADAEIRDPIHGPIAVLGPEVKVLDNPFVQRLRNIRQLGFAESTFPGATHSRYLHSVGAMHLAGKAFDAVMRAAPWLPPPERERLRAIVRLAALTHDLGHAPLSHSSERLFGPVRELGLPAVCRVDPERQASHEHYALRLLLDSDLADSIRQGFGSLAVEPEHVAALISDEVACDEGVFRVGGHRLRSLLAALISGEIDIDRMDYLLRDSYFTGASYGRFDHDWLISHLGYCEGEGGELDLALDGRALYAFDHFLLSRYHMFLMVYFHSKSVCYDEMLWRACLSAPAAFRVPVRPEDFLRFDDHAFYRILAERAPRCRWAAGILKRLPLGLIAERGPHSPLDPIETLAARLDRAAIEHIRVASHGALSKYGSRSRSRRIQVRLQPRAGSARFVALGKATRLFERFADETVQERIYVWPADVERVAAWVEEERSRGGH